MNGLSDQQLLRDYTGGRSEAAFAELVRRHVDLVYCAAMRMIRDAHLAEDVTQSVFVALARNARQLTGRSVLSGWLHRTAQNIAAQTVRTDVRRRAREQEAAAMNELLATEPDTLWEQIAPHLDAALGELSEPDRDALLLRYFERKSACEMAQTLGISDEAAQKRVSRAVERLREFFAKRGVTVGAGGLVVVIAANAVQAAPVGLAVTISTAALLTGAAVSTSTVIAATKAIAMTILQKIIIGATLAAAISTGIYEARQAWRSREENQSLQQQQTPLAEQMQQLEHERDDARNRLASLADELARTKSNNIELLKLRDEVARLRGNTPSQSNGPTDDAMKTWLVRVTKLKQRIAATPEAKIPECRFLSEDDYMAAARSALNTEGDYLRALANLRSTGEFQFITTLLNPALTQYAQANNGQFPTDIAQLKPYFPSPVEDAILQRWEIAPANTVRTDNFGDPIITQKAAVDENFDPRYAVGLKGFASAGADTAGHNGWGVVSPDIIMQMAGKAYEAANNGQAPTDPSQILPYLTTPGQQAAYQKLMIWNQQK
jgi:RNA polymerase sigma factor (sigma-70 family)